MGQHSRNNPPFLLAFLLTAALFLCGCKKQPATLPTTRSTSPTIASIVPAVTDMILQMQAQDHLVGISNYEARTPELAPYPRVGDYHVVDWEMLTRIHPAILALHRPRQDVSEVFQQRAASLNMQLLDIHMDRLEDIFPVIQRLGAALQEPAKARALADRLREHLSQVAAQSAGKPRIPTLITLDEKATFIVGSQNYLDDLLTLAGGTNVAGQLPRDYLNIDREQLLRLNPQAIIQFLPEATPQVIASARQFWASMPQLQAVQNNRVYIFNDWYLMLPSARVGDVAQMIADSLHPLTPTRQSTTTSVK